MIKVASFLTLDEAEKIKDALGARRIVHFVTSKGQVPGKYRDPYYQISVDAINYIEAKRIVSKVIANRIIDAKKCPKCKRAEYLLVEKRNIWERIYYLGVTRVQCKKCKTMYII